MAPCMQNVVHAIPSIPLRPQANTSPYVHCSPRIQPILVPHLICIYTVLSGHGAGSLVASPFPPPACWTWTWTRTWDAERRACIRTISHARIVLGPCALNGPARPVTAARHRPFGRPSKTSSTPTRRISSQR